MPPSSFVDGFVVGLLNPILLKCSSNFLYCDILLIRNHLSITLRHSQSCTTAQFSKDSKLGQVKGLIYDIPKGKVGHHLQNTEH